jgi:NCS1 family nucleobase:cation symporter-1
VRGSLAVERRSIEVIPEGERHGSAWSQFTLWSGANLQITAIVTGALAVVFGANAVWAIVGLLIGNLVGGIVMALHAAQGPRLGLPQMISSRAQFGVFGAVLPLALVVMMYLGFAATGTVLAGQAVDAVLRVDNRFAGIFLFGALTVLVAAFGYRLIHLLGRIATVAGAIGFGYLAVRLAAAHSIGNAIGPVHFDFPLFLLAVSLSAAWQLTYGPYVADYSRYLPAETSPRLVFATTYLGSVLGSQASMTLGALVAAVAGGAFLGNQVIWLGHLAGPAAVTALIYLVIVVGKLAVNCLNAYGGFMGVLTGYTAFTGGKHISRRGRVAVIAGLMTVAVAIALFASANFLSNFKNFVLALLLVFTPWSAINLTDYYLLRRDHLDTAALYDANGRYGKWNLMGLVSYCIGVAVQIPFMAQALYTGPITVLLHGADISWIVGLVVTPVLYYSWTRRRQARQALPAKIPAAVQA